MNKTRYTICKLLLVAAPLFSKAQSNGNGKKVYADYHGVRYTREHDGKLGRWSYYRQLTNSGNPANVLCYNADNILENGQHDIAAADYPLTGVQSDLDPDYIEYQILTAKAAKIDGFFIEWGFPEHESNVHLKAFQKVAAKYKFEIGVNWCDGWLYYDWITKIHPEINTREAKTTHFKYSFQYLIDSVFSVSTAPLVKGIPVYYLFGGGITNEEYKQVIDGKMHLPEGTAFPVALRRYLLKPELVNDIYTPPLADEEFKKWTVFGMSPTGWIPLRIRSAKNVYPGWDYYGTTEDAMHYMDTYKTVWNDTSHYHLPLKSGFAVPGMDNRGCAGWGHDIFYTIPRDNGKYYENLWKFNMRSKDKLDMMFIASWSDFTEGHEIQPTIENGYRELKTTLAYAAQFKDETYSDKGLTLPLQLFELRKKRAFFLATGINIDTIITTKLNNTALLISDAHYDEAAENLSQIKSQFTAIENSQLIADSLMLSNDIKINGKKQREQGYANTDSLQITLSKKTLLPLVRKYYTGYISFEYLDSGLLNDITIYGGQTKAGRPSSTTGQIKTAGSNEWKKARISFTSSNVDLSGADAIVIKLTGPTIVKNIGVDIITYVPKK